MDAPAQIIVSRPAQSDAEFQYDRALVRERSEIRILRLQPGEFQDPLNAELWIASSETWPTFEALSYTWGDSVFPEVIFIDGRSKGITKNLDTALRHLRYTDRCRDVWVDAVCINQDDQAEKGWQILLMGEIYTKAASTLIWLGEADEMMDLLFEAVDTIPADMDRDITLEELRKTGQLDLSRNIIKIYTLLLDIAQRPWCHRSWTLQEAMLPKADPLIMCGSHTVQWSHFDHCTNQAATCWSGVVSIETLKYLGEDIYALAERLQTSWRGEEYAPLLLRQQLRRQWHEQQGECKIMAWGDLLQQTIFLDATDPRDKVYSILGLLPPEESASIVIDYTAHPMDVFKSVIARFWLPVNMHYASSFDFAPTPLSTDERKFPSWVPDLSRKTTIFQKMRRLLFRNFPASATVPQWSIAGLPTRRELLDLDCIKLRGVIWEDVTECMRVKSIEEIDVFSYVFELRDRCRKLSWWGEHCAPLPILQGTIEGIIKTRISFARLFLANELYEQQREELHCMDRVPEDLREYVWQALGYWLDDASSMDDVVRACSLEALFYAPPLPSPAAGLNVGETVIAHARNVIEGTFRILWSGAGLARTHNGYCVLGPEHLMVGDKVCFVQGMSCPMLLRPNGNGRFTVVGAAFVSEVMNSDMVNDMIQSGLVKVQDILLV